VSQNAGKIVIAFLFIFDTMDLHCNCQNGNRWMLSWWLLHWQTSWP